MNPRTPTTPIGQERSINRIPINVQPNTHAAPSGSRTERIRLLRQRLLDCHEPEMASFFGEKLVVLNESMDYIDDVYNLALSYYAGQQYERALEILNKYDTLNRSVYCRHLAARCSLALSNGADTLDYLGHDNPFAGNSVLQENVTDGVKLESLMCFTRGQAYLLLGNYSRASACFKEALTIDARCCGALESLVKHNMMGEKEELEFVMTLPYAEHCGEDEDYFKYLYGLKLKKNILNAEFLVPVKGIEQSLDVQLNAAQKYLATGQYENCLKVCKAIKSKDSFFKESVTIHLSCLYELNMKIELCEYAHELVDRMNKEAVTWYAVGLFYLYVKKNLEARTYFNKALEMDQFLQEAWLGYGHSFAFERDHEQAIDAYISCSRLAPGSYLPLMNIAMEYMQQNQLDLASKYFTDSLLKCQTDPFLHNEVAVCYYKKGLYQKARSHLHEALKQAHKRQSDKSPIWEKIWCNLGHVYRHPPNQNYERALKCLKNAKERNPKNSDVRATMGMIYQIQNKTSEAIDEYLIALEDSKDPESVNELLDIAFKSQSQIHMENEESISDIGIDFLSAPEVLGEIEMELDDRRWS